MFNKADTLNLIKSIAKRGKTLDADIQEAAKASVFYSVCYGDVTIGQKLLEAMAQGQRKAALVGFLENFGQFEFKAGKLVYRKVPEFVELLEDVEASEQYVAEHVTTHWTAFKPEQISSKYNCIDAVKRLIAKMEKEIKAGNAEGSEIFDSIALAFNEYEESLQVEDEAQDQEAAPVVEMVKAA